ncbi:hypothetical protein J4Q44_G00147150 [Coregonus suidteri]|uniref:Uncharacterized protein n=1 Tax=Coregonus suidteri TaxID=861788 RepID=A0AAN8QX91_9TELE
MTTWLPDTVDTAAMAAMPRLSAKMRALPGSNELYEMPPMWIHWDLRGRDQRLQPRSTQRMTTFPMKSWETTYYQSIQFKFP